MKNLFSHSECLQEPSKKVLTFNEFLAEKKGPCWPGYKQVGLKKKNGRTVPNCVPA